MSKENILHPECLARSPSQKEKQNPFKITVPSVQKACYWPPNTNENMHKL